MGSTDRTSINTNRLTYTWKMEIGWGDSIKEGGDYEMIDWKIMEETL